ncbi:DUF3800 domain-containing protein [[Clostridium] scindens]|nr:DUF3800 domain-containing protein [[Clostridium] scindens]
MANYFLFLDELKANDIYTNFCMGGIFVEEQHYRKTVVPKMNAHKNSILGNTGKVLHENELYDLLSKYKDNKKIQKEKAIYDAIRDIIINCDVYTMCVGITKDSLNSHYPSGSTEYNKYRLYNVALQIIMENYVHFLDENNSYGCVFYESRNIQADYELQKQYELIKEHGTLYLSPEIMGKRLMSISFPLKIDNNTGLQIADFILNPMARKFDNMEQRENSLHNAIITKAYDGGISENMRYGIKKIL